MQDNILSAPQAPPPLPRRNPVHYVAAAVIILSLIAFILSCKLSTTNISQQINETSLAKNILGDTRTVLSSELYMQADLYFHKGVPHKTKRAFDSAPFQVVLEKVSPSQHVHLSGAAGIKEIMPWLDLSIKADPQKLNSYLDAAYWISTEGGRYDLALKIINMAQRNIKDSFEVQVEKGKILLRMGKFDAAIHAFSAAILFWNKTADPSDKEDILYKRQALEYRALLYENAGMTDAAIDDLKNMLALGMKSPSMEERLRLLQNGLQTKPPAHDLLASMLNKYDKQRHHCKHEGHEHDHEHEHEHHGEADEE